MKILLTGGTGFLGSHLVEKLLLSNHEVGILKRITSDFGRLRNLQDTCQIFNIEIDSIDTVLKKFAPNVIIHTAASYGHNQSWNEVVTSNLNFPLTLLETATHLGIETFINIDTSLPANTNPYAMSKKQFVQWLDWCKDKIQVLNVVMEYFYGGGDSDWKIVTMLIRKMLKNQSIDLGNGLPKRDFIYIDDAVSALLTILNQRDKLTNFENIGLGSGKSIQIKDLVLLCKSLIHETKSELNFGKIPPRPNEVMFTQADISLLNKLGWQPIYSLERGLLATIEFERQFLDKKSNY